MQSPRSLIMVLGAVGVTASVLVAALAASLPVPPAMGSARMRVESVTLEPGQPGPGDAVTVSARVTGVLFPRVFLAYAVQFGDAWAEVVGMARGAGDASSARIGPFTNGTEVWLFVAAFVGGGEPATSAPTAFAVGIVPRGGPSTLRINDAFESGGEPRFVFEAVTVTASVTSSAVIHAVILSYVRVARTRGDGAMVAMAPVGGSGYSADIPRWEGFDPWVIVAYRIAVRDETGNTAVSAVRMLIAQAPGPVP